MSVDFDAADVIESLDTGHYTVTRRGAVTYVDSIAVPGATSTFTIDASVQPASGRDLLRLPEGRRSVETRVVFTPTALLAGAQGGNNADLIAIDGDSWEVQLAETWPSSLAEYCRAIVQRVAAVQP